MPIHRAAAFALVILGLTGAAEASCDGSVTSAGCFDAVPLYGPSEPSPWMGIGLTRGLPGKALAVSSGLAWADTPAELVAPSGARSGKRIPVVDHSLRFHLRFSGGLGYGVDVLGSLGAAVAQSGAGGEATSAQRPTALSAAGLVDPAVGLRLAIPISSPHLGWTVRATTTVPVGDEHAYLGKNSMEPSLASTLSYAQHGWFFAGDTGLTVARSVRFGDVRLGTHASVGVGVARALVGADTLTFGVEGKLRLMLVDQPSAEVGTTKTKTVMPSEWLTTVTWHLPRTIFWFSLGAGTAFPTSTRTSSESHADHSFMAPSSPRWLAMGNISLLWPPPAAPQGHPGDLAPATSPAPSAFGR